MDPLKIIFMGTPDFAVPALRALHEAGHDVVCVYSQPPRPAGRGHREKKSPVHETAEAFGIPVRTPKSLKGREEQDAFRAFNADVAVVAAYGLILPKQILDAPKFGCINIHASLLPRWRGAAPIQRAIEAGDRQTGITIMQMDEGLDTGDILLQDKVPIGKDDTAQDIHDALAVLGGRLIVEALEGLSEATLKPEPQNDDAATYAKKLEKDEGRLDFTRPASRLERQVRAFTPWPGAYVHINGERIKVLNADAVETTSDAEPGAVLRAGEDGLLIACAEDALNITRLQRAGKTPMDAADFLRGFALKPGARADTDS